MPGIHILKTLPIQRRGRPRQARSGQEWFNLNSTGSSRAWLSATKSGEQRRL